MTTKKLSRKQFLMLAGSSVAAGALAACAPQATPTKAPAPTTAPAAAAPKAEPTKAPASAAPTAAPAAKAPTSIDFLAWGDPTDGPAWEKLVPAYQAKYPGQTVN